MKSKKRSVFAARLVEARKAKGWSQHDLANELGTHQQTVAFWETDRNSPRCEMLPRIADVLGVTTDFLLGVGECHLLDRIRQLEEALLLMVDQYCVRDGRLDHLFMCAGEHAFAALGLEQGDDAEMVDVLLYQLQQKGKKHDR